MATARTRLCLFDDRDGLTQLSGTLPTRHASMLRSALDAFASPTQPDPIARTREVVETDPATGTATTSTLPRQTSAVLGEALCRLLEHLDPTALPVHGGMSATVVVTIPLTTLQGGLAAATLDDGTPLSPGEARRIACDAGLIPAVLGTASEVLDLGRTARLFSRPQRLAMAIRQQHTCAARGCQRPAAWTEAHHLDPWAHGGQTDLERGVLLCSRHHTLAHHPDYTTTEQPHHAVSIERRPRTTPRRQ